MATLLVAYDLNAPGQRYAELTEHLKALGTWWHHLDSTWLVKTSLRPKQLRDDLRQYLDDGDELLVIDVSGDPAAWTGFKPRGSEWLKSNL